jgi:predicted membrane-bound spermidine synthase
MLSAFILGLAFGGLWIKRRIDGIAEPEKFLGVVQVAMGLLALATLVVYGHTFELMQWLFGVLARTDSGYAMFNLGSHLIALIVMFPAAFCAGMTLPLITHALLKRGAGEQAIGAVYAANTVGAIAGVFAAVHVGLPVLGLKGLISAGAALDIGLGLLLLWWVARGSRLSVYATATGVAALAATLAFVQLDPFKMASGVYRHGALMSRSDTAILYHRDGKTATVDVVKSPRRVSIHTNGKSDAALIMEPGRGVAPDEATMILTGALPLAYRPDARTAANIGIGSGLTSQVLLASDRLAELDTIEIEQAMVEAARAFSPRNDSVYHDSRSRIHIEDAKTFFSSHDKRYDIIASEPSNPWVSGVASLFTSEFYARVKRHLAAEGIFVQWMQLYEINPTLVASVMKALSGEFSDYAIYAATDIDLIIVAKNGGNLPPLSDAVFRHPRLAQELARIHVRSVADFELHRVGGKQALQPYFDEFRIPANSDYFPVLDLGAAKTRFLGARAADIVELSMLRIPALELMGDTPRRGAITEAARPWLRKSERTQGALALRAFLLDGRPDQVARIPGTVRSDAQLVRLQSIECAGSPGPAALDALFNSADAMVPFLTREELKPVWDRIGSAPCAARNGGAQRAWAALYAAVSARDPGEMAQRAEGLLRHEDGRARARRDYLLAIAIAGRLARNELDAAMGLWREFAPDGADAHSEILPGFLRSHLLRRGGQATAKAG